MTARRHRSAVPTHTPEGWPIRQSRYGRYYQINGRGPWYEHETPEEAFEKVFGRHRRQPVVIAAHDWSPFDEQ